MPGVEDTLKGPSSWLLQKRKEKDKENKTQRQGRMADFQNRREREPTHFHPQHNSEHCIAFLASHLKSESNFFQNTNVFSAIPMTINILAHFYWISKGCVYVRVLSE